MNDIQQKGVAYDQLLNEVVSQRSVLPLSGISKTPKNISNWVSGVTQEIRNRQGDAQMLIAYMWPYRMPIDAQNPVESLRVEFANDHAERVASISFMSAGVFSNGTFFESTEGVIECLVPDQSEALHICSMLIDELGAQMQLVSHQ